jgi:Uma2 family endonuclease
MSTIVEIAPEIERPTISVLASRTDVTPEELLAMPDGKHYELVDGVLVERTMSLLSGRVESKMIRILEGHCEDPYLGWVIGPSSAYRCFSWKPGKVRRPDASFIARDRLPAPEQWSEGYITIAPDLAVEITSPTDEVYDLEEKIEEYLRAGVRLIWVIHPEVRVVEIFRADGSSARIRAGGELSGENVVPGFRCPVAALFPAPGPPVDGETAPVPATS